MLASAARFTVPVLVARYVNRDPDDVAGSHPPRELTAWALVAPALSVLTLAGMFYIEGAGPGPEEGGTQEESLQVRRLNSRRCNSVVVTEGEATSLCRSIAGSNLAEIDWNAEAEWDEKFQGVDEAELKEGLQVSLLGRFSGLIAFSEEACEKVKHTRRLSVPTTIVELDLLRNIKYDHHELGNSLDSVSIMGIPQISSSK
mmetsp:Transcript_41231/g.80692  ORF Transcript_41231/g.80692 Transcript_41231/m.80692 type:complete len:201 (+) Transcript_41231:106-708(+)